MAAGRDETTRLDLSFDAAGLIPAIVTDAHDHTVLMFAYMNREALDLCLGTGQLHLYSRSRRALWKKGETSGETFQIIRILTDCDQDVVQIEVRPEGQGAACHTGRRSCFYRVISNGALTFVDGDRLFDPADVYPA
jgi:phosphoribosyl-AMP cyclohydrolase